MEPCRLKAVMAVMVVMAVIATGVLVMMEAKAVAAPEAAAAE
jgi:hypothetical protein